MSKSAIKSFGVIVNTLNNAQVSHTLVQGINDLVEQTYEYCPIVFFQHLNLPPFFLKCCQLQHQNAWGFKGPLISTSIETTQILVQCLLTPRKLFYVYDLEWLYLENLQYRQLLSIYDNPDIDLIARSERHFDILAKIWKKPLGVIHDFNSEEIKQLIDSL